MCANCRCKKSWNFDHFGQAKPRVAVGLENQKGQGICSNQEKSGKNRELTGKVREFCEVRSAKVRGGSKGKKSK